MKQRLLAIVSHDIRKQASIAVAGRNSKWLLELVCDLLDYENNLQAGRLSFHMQLCKVDEILSKAISIASPLANLREKSISFKPARHAWYMVRRI